MRLIVLACSSLFLTVASCWFLGYEPAFGQSQSQPQPDQLKVEAYKADRTTALHREDAQAAAALHREDASAALTQTIVDKGFLAILIAFVGLVISRLLDRYQALLIADAAIEEKRFALLDDIWTSVNECELLKHEVRSLLQRGARSRHYQRVLLEHQAEFDLKSATVRQKVSQKTHWLDRSTHHAIASYHNTLTRLFYAYVQGDVKGVVRLERELSRRKQYITDRRRLGGRFQTRLPDARAVSGSNAPRGT